MKFKNMKYFFTEIIYKINILITFLLQISLPYASVSEELKKQFFIFGILNLGVGISFTPKFKGSMEEVPLNNFLIYKIVAHLLPIAYYFLFRRVYIPYIWWFVAIIFCELISYLMLWLESKLYKYITIKE